MWKKPETHEFTIGEFLYRLEMHSEGQVVLFLLDGYSEKLNSNIRKLFEEPFDPLTPWGEYDYYDLVITSDVDVGANVFLLARECINRIAGWANKTKPGYFAISPSTPRKEKIYDRAVRILNSKIKNYAHFKIDNTHYFYRMNSAIDICD